ncbi:MAG: thrombospondin type 3 repeat-containing protein, partial [Candidatus Aenigmatarchaeota archaeon]
YQGFCSMNQEDTDGDKLADACDTDDDKDGWQDRYDYCPLWPGRYDVDNDEICGNFDNCPAKYNEDQLDQDNDMIGDVCDICPLDFYNDADSDSICGNEDAILGKSSNIISNIECLEFRVDDQKDRATFNGLAQVKIIKCAASNPLIEFNFDFSDSSLDLSTVEINTSNNGSAILIKNINLTAQNKTKSAYINSILGTKTVCVQDSEYASLSVTGDCSNGIKITCPNNSSLYTCEELNNGTIYKVNGLSHSSVIEYSYTPPASGSGGGGGGGGGGGRTRTCAESWICTEWSLCQPNGKTTRTCTDKNKCGTTEVKPFEERSCYYFTKETIDVAETQDTIVKQESEPVSGKAPEKQEIVEIPEDTTESTGLLGITGALIAGAGQGGVIAAIILIIVIAGILAYVYKKKE